MRETRLSCQTLRGATRSWDDFYPLLAGRNTVMKKLQQLRQGDERKLLTCTLALLRYLTAKSVYSCDLDT